VEPIVSFQSEAAAVPNETGNVQLDVPLLTGILKLPLAAGVPLAVNVIVFAPVFVKVPLPAKVIPLVAVVVKFHEPAVVTFTFNNPDFALLVFVLPLRQLLRPVYHRGKFVVLGAKCGKVLH